MLSFIIGFILGALTYRAYMFFKNVYTKSSLVKNTKEDLDGVIHNLNNMTNEINKMNNKMNNNKFY